jgi:hypothetical protein
MVGKIKKRFLKIEKTVPKNRKTEKPKNGFLKIEKPFFEKPFYEKRLRRFLKNRFLKNV